MRKNKALLSGSKCPGNMARNTIVTNPDKPSEKVKVTGFVGLPGYRYHPTKGLKKQSGFNPRDYKIKEI